MEVYSVRDLTFTYPEQTAPALDHLSFAVSPGDFITIIGPSGSGKSTLLRQLKPDLAPHGTVEGQIFFCGTALEQLPDRARAGKIGFVMQNPDNQVVTDKVWHELAFGLESLGEDTETIRRRTAEMASFFGIESWFYRNVAELSGGQKQLLNLASIMVMEPEVLILDEPTSQLDPIAAADFLAVLGRINRELGTTVVLTEHRLEDVFPLCSRVLAMEKGRILCDGTPKAVGEALKARGSSSFLSMPTPMRIWAAVENHLPCPVTVAEGRVWLDRFAQTQALRPVPEGPQAPPSGKTALRLDEVWFRYEKDSPDVLRGLTMEAAFGQFLCVMGGNGTGKSTTLSLLSGARTPYRGTVQLAGRAAVLPQDAQMLFAKKTVRQELLEAAERRKDTSREDLLRMIRLCRLEHLLDRHPYDLSGGEQQRAALAKVLLGRPEILLLDEPTKGLDAAFKHSFASILRSLTQAGVCVVMVSHDVEFCAQYADRCALFFDGGIVAEDTPARFFAQGSFYTTTANRMARHQLPGAVTVADVVSACGGSLHEVQAPAEAEGNELPLSEALLTLPKPAPLPLWRKLTAALSGAAALGSFAYALRAVDLTEVLTTGDLTRPANGYQGVYLLLMAALIVLALAINKKSPSKAPRAAGHKRKLSRRTVAAAGMILLAVPLTILAGMYLLDDRRYYVISLLVIVETMLPFALVFEGRKPRPRELVILAALCALGVACRGAFIALPGFKPVMALVIVAGVAFGGETGFLVGAVTMFASNLFFGQGPWTPWQMFAMGITGFLAGVLFRPGGLRRGRLALCVFGVLAAVVVYGGLMNPASVLMYQSAPTWAMVLTAYVTGFPMDLLHAASTAIFLWFAAEPMLEKLERVKLKYGLVE